MTDSLQVAHKLVRAYNQFDAGALEAVLHPDVRYEGVSSNGIEEFKGARPLLDAYGPWFGWYDSQQVLDSDVRLVAGLPWAVVRHRLRKGDESWVMEMHHCIYDQDEGRITWLGMLCTGPQPER